jgi:16S rRNA (cytidine1402-2'-O)-methyltransferase
MDIGSLYIVSTPIGNLEDITMRALRILKEVDLIAAEDTRHTRKLLSHYDIHTQMTSYHIHNEHHKVASLLDRVEGGESIAVVSDAGTPAIADPGFLIVRAAWERDIHPIVIPGVSSLTFAIAAAGLPVDSFTFKGFIPVKKGRRTKALESVIESKETTVFFESPYRIKKLLQEINDILGSDTVIAVIREATKIHEEVLRGPVSEILEATAERNKWKGECVVIIGRI